MENADNAVAEEGVTAEPVTDVREEIAALRKELGDMRDLFKDTYRASIYQPDGKTVDSGNDFDDFCANKFKR